MNVILDGWWNIKYQSTLDDTVDVVYITLSVIILYVLFFYVGGGEGESAIL